MGKYMRKSKGLGEVAVMDVSQGSLGVRTRAQKDRNLAPRRSTTSMNRQVDSTHTSYLELRSRRLEKISPCQHARKPSDHSNKSVEETKTSDRSSRRHSATNSVQEQKPSHSIINDTEPPEIEASFGENVTDHDSRERCTRETTPCSHMRESQTIDTPGSTTRSVQASSARRTQNEARASQFDVPSSNEIEEFFAGAEQQEQRRFTERYNYDPVSDLPLPGRFEWVRLRP